MSCCCCVVLVTQLCPTFCSPMDCSLPGSSIHGDSPGKNTGVCCYALFQGIFPTQEWNPGLLLCRRILYRLPSEPPGMEDPIDRGAWEAMVHRVTKSRTQLKHRIMHARANMLLLCHLLLLPLSLLMLLLMYCLGR